ncbi:MAG TPA: hypothetical protein VL992_13100 [Tepidisphaeraceae bacterium]|nr:hypothetical protein [Tepidisphaeraceae bacterium]
MPVFLLIFASGARADGSLKDFSDDSLRIELANDGLNTLLDRAFVVDQIPPDARGPEMAVIALHELCDPNLKPAKRAERIQQVVAGIRAALPRINDPHILLSAAATLVKEGVEPDVNVLEYFGDDGSQTAKARLQPVVAAAVAMYQRAVDLLDAQQTALQSKISAMGDAASQQWQNVYKDFQTASYTRWMLSYSYVISLEAGDKNRAAAAEEAIGKLDQWDNPDSGVQALVRLQQAKLLMAENRFRAARQKFLSVFVGSSHGQAASPPADRFTQFNARYFYAVTYVLAGDAASAEEYARAADDFRKEALDGVAGDEYAMEMLRYRIAVLNHDDPGAAKILQDLSGQAPGLRAVIAAHLLERLPPHPDPNTLPPLILSAMVEKALVAAGQASPDASVLNDGLAAAQRYLALADQADPQTTTAGAIEASWARGVILNAEGQTAAAATAYLDHAQRYTDDLNSRADDALDQAIGLIGDLYRADSGNPHQTDIEALEDRLLPLAVDAFHRYDLAYDYARRLQRSGHPAHAAEIFDLVPADDPNLLNATFFKMVALNQCLDADPRDLENAVSQSDLPKVVARVQTLEDRFQSQVQQRLRASPTAGQAQQLKSMLSRTTLLAADIALRQGRDPGRTLQLLNGYEQTIAALPDANSLLAEALNLRVAAYMGEGDTLRAANTLVEYLNRAAGEEGLQTVYNLLTKLNQQLDRAQLTGQIALARQLAEDRAALTPYLVKWAQSNSNSDIRKYTYRYMVFDAATQQQAAELEPDPRERRIRLEAAMDKYHDLQSPQQVKQYQDSLPADIGDDVRNYPDPQVELGIGEVAFALGDWKQAHDCIGELLADSKLGDGTIIVKNAAGQEEEADNNQFWEAQYKFIDATLQMSRDPSTGVDPATPRTMLARLAAVWQDHLGGAKWHAKFVALEKEMQ